MFLSLVFFSRAGFSFPDCTGCDLKRYDDFEEFQFLSRVSEEAADQGLGMYFNALYSAPEFQNLQGSCEKIANTIRKQVDLDLNSAAGIDGNNQAWKLVVKRCDMDLESRIRSRLDDLVAYYCGESKKSIKLSTCGKEIISEGTKNSAHVISVKTLKKVSADLRAMDSKIVRLESVLRGVSCSVSSRLGLESQAGSLKLEFDDKVDFKCLRDGKQLYGKESKESWALLQNARELVGRRSELLNAYPILGLSEKPGSKFKAETSYVDAALIPFERGKNLILSSAGDKEAVSDLELTRFYERMVTDDPIALNWAKTTSRRMSASVALTHVCGGKNGSPDLRSLATELIRAQSPMVDKVLKDKFQNDSDIFCRVRATITEDDKKLLLRKAALGFSAAAIGIAAAPFTGITSLGLVATSGAVGAGLTTNNTQQGAQNVKVAESLNQICQFGFKALAEKELEYIELQNEALLNYGMEGVGLVAEGIKFAKAGRQVGKVGPEGEKVGQVVKIARRDGLTFLKGRPAKQDVLQIAEQIPDLQSRAAFTQHINQLRQMRPEPQGLRQAEWWWFEYFKNGKDIRKASQARIPIADLDGMPEWMLEQAKKFNFCGKGTVCEKYPEVQAQMEQKRKALVARLEGSLRGDTLSYEELMKFDDDLLELNDYTVEARYVADVHFQEAQNPGAMIVPTRSSVRSDNTELNVRILTRHPLDELSVTNPFSGLNASDMKVGVAKYDGAEKSIRFYRDHDFEIHGEMIAMVIDDGGGLSGLASRHKQWASDWSALEVASRDFPEAKKLADSLVYELYHEKFQPLSLDVMKKYAAHYKNEFPEKKAHYEKLEALIDGVMKTSSGSVP